MRATDKRLNEMNRLTDMLHFPALVNAGATLNVLLTMAVTWLIVEPRWLAWPAPWVALVLALNLLPVAWLRLGMGPESVYPRLGEMSFFRDQHKFSDWVYVAASANMAFWVMLTWTVAEISRSAAVLGALLTAAAVVTFAPVLARAAGSGQR